MIEFMVHIIKIVISSYDKWFLPLITSLTLVFSIRTFYVNKNRDQPRIKIIFEPVDFIKASTSYNIIIKNEGNRPIYNLRFINKVQINNIINREIGFINITISIFESGQVFKSYFTNFKELRERGIDDIEICYEYALTRKGKGIGVKNSYNTTAFTKYSSLEVKSNN